MPVQGLLYLLYGLLVMFFRECVLYNVLYTILPHLVIIS